MAVENDKKLKNIRALKPFRLQGKHVAEGEVVPKDRFINVGEFMNLCAMSPARAEQTNDPVGKPKAAGKLPGSK